MSEPTSGGFTTQVAGRTVVVRTGTRSQTVNICTSANVMGQYEDRFRLDLVNALIDPSDIAERESLDDLRTWLLERNARSEGATGTPPPPPEIVLADPSDPWVDEAVEVVDAAIDSLVEEFILRPYRHRVEHSLHTQLVTSLMASELLSGLVRLEGTTEATQLIHKEWPETEIRHVPGRSVERRGLFDVVVLSPSQIERTDLDQFRQGLIAPSIAIEIGLDYGAPHLQQDFDKFANSNVMHGRLIHLTRRPTRRGPVEDLLESLPVGGSVRGAYGSRDPSGRRAVKLLGDPGVRELGSA